MSKSNKTTAAVSKDDVVKLLSAMGFKTASKWPRDRLAAKLAKFHTLVEEASTTRFTPQQTKLCAKLVAAAKASKIAAITSGWASSAGKAAKASTKKAGGKISKGKAKAKAKATTPVNAYGFRVGTIGDKVVTAMVKGGTPEAIAKASGATVARVRQQRAVLEAKKHKVVETKSGSWKLQKAS